MRPDCAPARLHRPDGPALRVVVLRRPCDDGEVVPRGLISVHEASVAHLLDSVGIAIEVAEDPALRVAILRRSRDHGKIVLGDYMRVQEASVAQLLDRVGAQAVCPRPYSLIGNRGLAIVLEARHNVCSLEMLSRPAPRIGSIPPPLSGHLLRSQLPTIRGRQPNKQPQGTHAA